MIARGLVASISDTTIWCWLGDDAIRPWTHRSWIFPRDPDFAAKAGRVLDLYAGEWHGQALRSDEFVLSADEKTSIQARVRGHPTLPPGPARAMRLEFEYERGGALQYLAAWDVHRAKLFGRCEPSTGIEPFDRLVAQVMAAEPYRSARRVFWVIDNGSSHRGQTSVRRLTEAHPKLVPVPSAHPRLLAQPGRDLLQHPPAQGPHAGRCGLARGAHRSDHLLPGPLRDPRRAIRMEVHPSRSHEAPRTPGDARSRLAGRGCVNTSPNIRATALRLV